MFISTEASLHCVDLKPFHSLARRPSLCLLVIANHAITDQPFQQQYWSKQI